MSFLKWLMAVLGLMTLVACGGGGGNAGTSQFGTGSGTNTGTGTGTLPSTGVMSITLSISKTTISVGSPATLTAAVTTAGGAPAAGQVVNFSSASGLGAFSATSALTDAAGLASVQLSPASTTANGADLAVASLVAVVGGAPASGTVASATIGFQAVSGTVPAAGTPTLAVALSSTAVTSTSPVTLTATLRDAGGAPIAGQIVKFSTVDSLGTFNVSSALSDASGRATARLSPATTSTNGADLALATATVNATLVTGAAAFSVSSSGAPVVGTPSIALALSTNTVTTATPATVTASVKDASGAGVAGQVVKFRTVDGLGTLNVASALTDASGAANVTLSATTAGASGADQVVANTTVNGTALQSALGFRLTAPDLVISAFTSDVPSLSAFGQTNLTVVLAGSPAGTPAIVSVSSACVAKGKASLTPSTATTTTGSATFTYRDLGCGATDVFDSLQASVSGAATTRSLSIGLTPPEVSSITFISASPSTIFLKGTGLTETSTVVFRVLDTGGNGLPNQSVRLEATTLAGGLTLDGGPDAVTKLSDSLGNVSVMINSGTVPTPVRVKATLTARSISTVSSNLSIAVGLPSQLNFSLAQQTLNIEGANIDGIANTYSIIASDRLGNPVPSGTAINFLAEGGQVEASKVTALQNGLARASANFVSAEPRPADGRITIVAYALGEESFLDVNGNNTFDGAEDFQDLGDVFLDRNFDGLYDSAVDQRIPLLLPGGTAVTTCAPTGSDLLKIEGDLRSAIPSRSGTCDGVWGRAYVRRATETVLSTSTSRLFWASADRLYARSRASCGATTLDSTSPALTRPRVELFLINGDMTRYALSRTGVLSFVVADTNSVRLNPVAAGSTIEVSATTGITASLVGGSPVPSTSEATFASVQYEFTSTTSGTITVKVRSPSGLTTAIGINVTTNDPDSTTNPIPIPPGSVICP